MNTKALYLVSVLLLSPFHAEPALACGYCKHARQAFEAKDYKTAAVVIEKSNQANSRCSEMSIVRANAFLLQGKNYKALDEINRALKAYPNNARLWLTRAEIHEKLKNPKLVISDATNAIKHDRKLAKAYLIRARAYYTYTYFMLSKDPKNKERGLRDLDTAIKLNPSDPDGYEYKAVWLMANDKYKEAIAPLTIGLKLSPKHKKLLSYRSMAYSETGQYDKAISDLTRLIAVEPSSSLGWKKRGNLYVQTNKIDKAFSDYTKAIQLAPEDYRLKYRHASVCMKLKKYKLAIQDYQKITRRNPLDDDAVKKLGDAYFASGETGKSIKYYTEAIELSPQLNIYYTARGKAYEKLGKLALAKRDYAKARRLKSRPAVKKI